MAIITGRFQGIEHFLSVLRESAPENGTTGKIFMLDFEESPLLPRAALEGWEVSGICNNQLFIDELRNFCENNKLKYSNLICGDLVTFDCHSIANHYDLLISSGLFLHESLHTLKKWMTIVKSGGVVFSGIPNCNSLNGILLKKFDPGAWSKISPHTLESFDRLHIEADLIAKKSAYYGRGIDINMLVPWQKIKEKCPSLILFKLLRYLLSGLTAIMSPFVSLKSKKLNSFIYAIYENK